MDAPKGHDNSVGNNCWYNFVIANLGLKMSCVLVNSGCQLFCKHFFLVILGSAKSNTHGKVEAQCVRLKILLGGQDQGKSVDGRSKRE